MRVPALNIIARLREAGHVAYLAGGCVRDRLLDVTPQDHDVATDATPTQVRRLFRRTQSVGESFGVVLVDAPPTPSFTPPLIAPLDPPRESRSPASIDRAADATPTPDAEPSKWPRFVTVEVATFRTDGTYSDGRRPDGVSFSDPAHDAQRRDFTVNALFEDPGELSTQVSLAPRGSRPPDPIGSGRGPVAEWCRLPDGSMVIDYVGGLADLETRTLRAVGEPGRRFAEDYLRMIRAVRFASRLDFELDPATAGAIRDHGAKLADVARERLGQEVRRILTGPRVGQALQLLEQLGLIAPLLGEAESMSWPAALHDRLEAAGDVPTRLAAWWLDLRPDTDPARVRQWRQALALSNDETAALRRTLEIVGVMMDPAAWEARSVAGRKRLLADARGPQALLLQRVARRAPDAPEVPDRSTEAQALADDGVGLAPRPLLDGAALIAAGLRPGPRFRTLLDRAYDRQLEGRITSADEALAWALSQEV